MKNAIYKPADILVTVTDWLMLGVKIYSNTLVDEQKIHCLNSQSGPRLRFGLLTLSGIFKVLMAKINLTLFRIFPCCVETVFSSLMKLFDF